ncbi:MmgE/PrpD family protein [Achromobacter sp. GG226]|uniref:MmgE/PrpD family protein n=1 Tax=Verticiella alkaliphila TaxID=2779529 RepID=UPI001C0D7AD4|nr:MmgE/PrpD family protein [Verticiella sp. GG226]MBU4611504.1 MmgE/PrpD family protein [Verticiella sp. GG226]
MASAIDQYPARDAVTARIAHDMAQIRYETLSPQAVTFAKHCLLDWLGVALAGSREPLTAILREQAAEEGACGPHRLVGTSQTVSMQWAALINGAASHALDFDDVVSAMGGHPSVPVFPALLAAAEPSPTSGRAFIAAFVAGFETECRVGAIMRPGHYARGFHATGTVGSFGAAAACAHLMGLDEPAWRTALGLAGTQAAGLKSMFGTMAKPLHAGKAAANGLLAAGLARRGFTAHAAVIETEQGFAATQTDTYSPHVLDAMHEIDGITRVMFKYHAACYLTHASIEAAAKLSVRPDLRAAEVESVRVLVPPGHLQVCNIPAPATGLEAKFSLRQVVAMALTRRDTSERGFTDALTLEPDLVQLRDRVHIVPSDDLPNPYSSEVAVSLRGGQTHIATADVSRACPPSELPLQWQKLLTKFTALAEPVVGTARARELADQVAALDCAADVRHITSLTIPRA